MSAALDAVKENVELPWRSAQQNKLPSSDDAASPAAHSSAPPAGQSAGLDVLADPTGVNALSDATTLQPALAISSDTAPSAEQVSAAIPELATPSAVHRKLHRRNFDIALKEITPSSSESLGTLADLRRWNEEFGEGRKEKKKQVWGKGRFGFTPRPFSGAEEGKVQSDSLSNAVTSSDQP